ncbi:sensor histidine kinase [Raoultibacter timonensis]|uniref:sensor histidine kinase n=1 Tax=Raoultibacter timonensis TaxID=1907662 RepID=UPI000C85CCBE|nr:HAMP domain-containing sensor histidine kinase [Raoultibacter timonensis]
MMQRIRTKSTLPTAIEGDRLRRESIRYTALFFVVFGLIFALLGVFVYQTVSSNIFQAVDEQLSVSSLDGPVNISSSTYAIGAPDAEAVTGDESTASNISLSESISATIESNPQTIFLTRSSDGTPNDTYGIYASYPEFIENLPFDSNVLNTPYLVEQDGHHYRAINYQLEGGESGASYMQAIANVDSEIAILDQFIAMLVAGLVVALAISAGASYLLSRMTLRPIADAWAKQTEFVQNASHELRTPLTVIRTTQELLLDDPHARIVDKFEDITLTIEEAERLSRLTESLLVLTATDAGHLDLETSNVDLRELCTEIVSAYGDIALMQEKTLALDECGDATVRGDRDKLRQLLAILLDNALKYTGEGDAVRLSVASQGSEAVVTVKDTGIGIDEGDLERVFDRFYRADTARSRETGGSGLGLPIAKGIAEAHGGTIRLENVEPRGIAAVVRLPNKKRG